MTRQNQIPAIGGEEADTALIPLWDMCNHTTGQVIVFYAAPLHSCKLKLYYSCKQVQLCSASLGRAYVHRCYNEIQQCKK